MNHILNITKHTASEWYADLFFKYINKNMKIIILLKVQLEVRWLKQSSRHGPARDLAPHPVSYGLYNLGLLSSNFWRPIPLIIPDIKVKFATKQLQLFETTSKIFEG